MKNIFKKALATLCIITICLNILPLNNVVQDSVSNAESIVYIL